MDLIQSFVLGIVQGVTEYLPVSSTAHLILVPLLLDWHFPQEQEFIFDILVQLGTLVGVIVYFASDLWEITKHMWQGLLQKKPLATPQARLGWLVILATIPAGVAGIGLKKYVKIYFASPSVSLYCLLVTAGLLVLAEFLGRKHDSEVKIKNALAMGFMQIVALLPGISRSGSTITAGVLSGLSKESAARFSFLMSVPVMLGASLVASKDILDNEASMLPIVAPVLVGMITSGITGYFIVRWFLNFLKTQSLLWFAFYCALVGGVGLILYG